MKNNSRFALLGIRDFRLLMLTRLFTVAAMQAQGVVVGWQVYSLTKSLFLLGFIALAEAVPAISCSLFSGYVVDRGRPRRIYAVCLGVLLANSLALLLLAGGVVPLNPTTKVVWIFVGVFLSGLARGFLAPVIAILRAQILPDSAQQAKASVWMTNALQLGLVGGPALAGVVYGSYGAQVAWMIPCSFVALALAMVLRIRVAHPVRAQQREPAWHSIKAGWRFIWENPVLLSVMVLDMFAVLFGGAVAMLPAYADQVLHVGSEGLGALRAAPAVGAMVMGGLLVLRPLRVISAKALLFSVAAFGVCMIGFGLSQIFALSLAFLLVSGMVDSISMVIRATLMQVLTPPEMLGRVASVNSMFIMSSNEIGAFESGMAAGLLGLVPSVVAGGVATLGVVAGTALLSPKFRRKTVVL
jgi:MFS family permease